MSTNDNETKQIIALEKRRYQAMLDGDLATLSDLCSDKLYYIHSNGDRDDKESYLAKVRSNVFVYHNIYSSGSPDSDRQRRGVAHRSDDSGRIGVRPKAAHRQQLPGDMDAGGRCLEIRRLSADADSQAIATTRLHH